MAISTDKENLKRHVEEICQRSPRYPGTEGEAKTREYIAAEGEKAGLQVEVEQFQYLHHWPKSSSLEITAPVESKLDNLPLCYAGSGTAEGDVIYAGPGTQEEFELLSQQGIVIKDKIVLASTTLTFIPCTLAQQYGASGVVIISDAPDNLIRAGNATLNLKAGLIPAVAVSPSVGQRLLTLMTTGRLRLRVTYDGEFSNKTSANVIMTVPGVTFPDEQVILVAHYDSHNLGKHANDNAVGCAGIMELICIFNQLKPARTVKAIFTSVEELGLWGACAYADRHAGELPNMKGVIAFDSIGNPFDSVFQLMTTAEIGPFASEIVKELGYDDAKCAVELRPGGDHAPFQNKGVPCLWLAGGTLTIFYHTSKDDPELLSYDRLKLFSDINGEIARRLATDKSLPF